MFGVTCYSGGNIIDHIDLSVGGAVKISVNDIVDCLSEFVQIFCSAIGDTNIACFGILDGDGGKTVAVVLVYVVFDHIIAIACFFQCICQIVFAAVPDCFDEIAVFCIGFTEIQIGKPIQQIIYIVRIIGHHSDPPLQFSIRVFRKTS